MSDLNKLLKCDNQTELYAWLSRMVAGNGTYIAQQGEMIEKSFGNYMKYHLKEPDAFKEI